MAALRWDFFLAAVLFLWIITIDKNYRYAIIIVRLRLVIPMNRKVP